MVGHFAYVVKNDDTNILLFISSRQAFAYFSKAQNSIAKVRLITHENVMCISAVPCFDIISQVILAYKNKYYLVWPWFILLNGI